MAGKMPSDMVAGTEFDTNTCGRLIVLKYNSHADVKVKFTNTGYESIVQACDIRRGKVKDKLKPSVYGVGFTGDGEFSTKDRDSHQCWVSMLARCYSKKFIARNPTYKGCIVCDEWHNFQNFAKWYYENYPKDGEKYQLDKDLSCCGERGKLYSPDTCLFVTAQVNSENAFAKSYKFVNPEGEIVDIYNLRKFCMENCLQQGSMCQVANGKASHHKGWKLAP